MNDELPAGGAHISVFERIRRTNDAGNEYWSSRDLAGVLGYADYRNFEAVVAKARTACFTSGQRMEDHFVDVTEMIEIGKGGQRKIQTAYLSRYAYHGYQGLYGGLGMQDIHKRKGLKKSQHILDHMGSEELGANIFRATQAESKIRREGITGKEKANLAHREVGAKVRQTSRELGGTMPEDLPIPVKSVKQLGKKTGTKAKARLPHA